MKKAFIGCAINGRNREKKILLFENSRDIVYDNDT